MFGPFLFTDDRSKYKRATPGSLRINIKFEMSNSLAEAIVIAVANPIRTISLKKLSRHPIAFMRSPRETLNSRRIINRQESIGQGDQTRLSVNLPYVVN